MIGTTAGPPAERRVRERDALPRPRLRRHALRLGQHVSTVIRPAALAAAESPAQRARRARRDRRRQRGRLPDRHGGAGRFHARGFHPTAICGIFGATQRSPGSRALDATTTTSALGIAGSFAGGLFAYLDDGTPTKPMHPAWAAHGGHLATRLATHGAAGPRSVLEGSSASTTPSSARRRARSTSPDSSPTSGARWETPRIAYKPYPVCHFIHGALGAAADGAAGRTFAPDEIEDVVVTVPAAGVSLVLEPAATKIAPRSDYEGEVLAPVLDRVDARPRSRRRVATSPTRRSPTRRCSPSPARSARDAEVPTYPEAFPGGVRVTLADGTSFEADFPYQKGGPENPMTSRRDPRKFRENVALALDTTAVEALEEARPRRSMSWTTSRAPRAADAARPPLRRDADRRAARDRRSACATASTATSSRSRPSWSTRRVPGRARRDDASRSGSSDDRSRRSTAALGLGLDTYALIVIELSRGWMTLSGIVNGTFIAALDDPPARHRRAERASAPRLAWRDPRRRSR